MCIGFVYVTKIRIMAPFAKNSMNVFVTVIMDGEWRMRSVSENMLKFAV